MLFENFVFSWLVHWMLAYIFGSQIDIDVADFVSIDASC